jgi:hypothetical protein
MASIQPQILKQTALAKATQLETRVNLLVASSTTELSPVVVYLEGAVSELSVHGDTAAAGVWTCPAGVTALQVECWGAGGGGGGGTTTSGGGGGGGGEYACEPNYAVIPGNVYTYAVGRAGQGGISAGQGGWGGGDTIFDTSANGVTANGGLGGDTGNPNNGGTGSVNTIHFDGGAGGVSSSGIASDNPIALGSVSNVGLWWVFKGTNASNGALASIYDDSGRSRTGSVVNTGVSGLKSAVISVSGPPAQTPGANGHCAYFKQNLTSSTPSYVASPIFGVGTPTAAPWDGSAFTVSAWINGDLSQGTWSYLPAVAGRKFGTIIADCDYAAGFHTGGNDANSTGYALYMYNNCPGFYLNPAARSVSSGKTVTSGTPLPIDGTWHQVVGTFDGTNMKLYVDGALIGTQATTWTKFGSGNYAHTAGVNPHTKTDSGFTGYMSNVWIADVCASSAFITEAYGSSPATGGSGGGASGGSAGPGLAGTSSTNTSGAAAGGAVGGTGTQLGSGAGGAGGNQHVSGSNAPVSTPFGGAGGGAGAPVSTAAVTSLSVSAIQSASYCGFDAQGGNAGAIYAVSGAEQAGTPNPTPSASLVTSNTYVGGTPSAAYNGSFNSMVLFPQVKPQLSGQTVNSMTLSFTVQSTNASVLPVWYAIATAGVTQLPTSFGSDADITSFVGGGNAPHQVVMIPIPAGAAGRQVTFDITNSTLATAFAAGNLVALVLGGFQGDATYDIGDGAYSNADSFAWNTVVTGTGATDPTTDMTINFELYPTASSNLIGGDGAPGSIVLSFIDPRYWPVCAIEPAATTDANNNAFAAGITTDSVMGFDPTVVTPPRVVETWHSLGALAGGSGLTMGTARYRYAPDDGGTLVLQIAFYLTNGTVVTGGNYNFAVTLPAALRPSVSPTAANDQQTYSILNQNASGLMSASLFGIAILGRNNAAAGRCTLVVNFNSTASGNSWNSVILRIPLT